MSRFLYLFFLISCTQTFERTKLDSLNESANFLVQVNDGVSLKSDCQISSKDAGKMLLVLHAKIDEENKNKSPTTEKNCANKTKKEDLIECANQTSIWFCKSELLVELKKDMPSDAEGM